MGRVSDLLLAPLGLLGGVPRLYVVVLLRGHRRRVVVLAEGVEVLLVRVQVRVQVRVRVRVRVRVQVRFGFGFGFGLGLEESVLLKVPLAAVLVHDALREARSTK